MRRGFEVRRAGFEFQLYRFQWWGKRLLLGIFAGSNWIVDPAVGSVLLWGCIGFQTRNSFPETGTSLQTIYPFVTQSFRWFQKLFFVNGLEENFWISAARLLLIISDPNKMWFLPLANAESLGSIEVTAKCLGKSVVPSLQNKSPCSDWNEIISQERAFTKTYGKGENPGTSLVFILLRKPGGRRVEPALWDQSCHLSKFLH